MGPIRSQHNLQAADRSYGDVMSFHHNRPEPVNNKHVMFGRRRHLVHHSLLKKEPTTKQDEAALKRAENKRQARKNRNALNRIRGAFHEVSILQDRNQLNTKAT